MQRLEAGSYRIKKGTALFGIEMWFGKWEVLPLNYEAELIGSALVLKRGNEVPVLGQFRTLKRAVLFTKELLRTKRSTPCK